jgi:recombination protein RecT|tara:strand:+ start:4222 stop:5217 length:996 start_codon:yes stop_codon:yes gene_type:complete
MSNQVKPQWEQSLGKAFTKFQSINPEKALIELSFAKQIFESNSYLQRCEPQSVMNAVLNVARTSITLNPIMKLAYLIPRKNKCVLEFSYMGLVSLLKDNNCIKNISAHIVYSDEEFKFDISQNKILHTPKYADSESEHNNRKVYGAYSRAVLPTNEVIYEFMPFWELEKIKNTSEGSSNKYSAWNNWTDEMYKKSVIKRHFKTLISVNPSVNVMSALEVEHSNMKMQLDEMNKSVNDNSNILTSFAKQNNENEIDENQLSLIEEISQKESLDIIDETKIDELIKKEEDKLNVLSDIIDEDISDKDRENYLEEEFEKINQSELLNQSKLFDE